MSDSAEELGSLVSEVESPRKAKVCLYLKMLKMPRRASCLTTPIRLLSGLCECFVLGKRCKTTPIQRSVFSKHSF